MLSKIKLVGLGDNLKKIIQLIKNGIIYMFSRSFNLNFLPHLHITQNFKNLKNMKNMKKFQTQNFKNVKAPFDSEFCADSKDV